MGAKKVDGIQSNIVAALRGAGASVVLLHTVGKGCPDILAGYQNRNVLFEIKSARGRLTPQQIEWHANWNGQVHTVYSPEEAMLILQVSSLTKILSGVPR